MYIFHSLFRHFLSKLVTQRLYLLKVSRLYFESGRHKLIRKILTLQMSEYKQQDLIIRSATRLDMVQVHKLIKELAEFEKLEDQVKIDSKTLETDGFDTENPAFTCLVAELQSTIIGFALYYISYSTWLGKSIFLEDLYVQQNYRKNGIGKQLLLEVAQIAYNTSKRLDFHVLKWNPAINFYKSVGAINLSNTEQWELFRLNENALNKLFS